MTVDINLVKDFFKNDRFAAFNNAVIDSVSEELVVCGMELTPNHLNAVGGVQGGAIFTLADFTFAVHSNLGMLCGDDLGATVGQSCGISFLKPAKGRRLIAKSTRVSSGRNVSVYRVSVEDELGTMVAEMLANGFRTAKDIC